MSISKNEFKRCALAYMHANFSGMKINSEALRYLRKDILRNVRKAEDVEDVFALVFTVLRDRGIRRVKMHELDEWLGIGSSTPHTSECVGAEVGDEGDGNSESETEWVPPDNLAGRPLWDVRRILRSYKKDGQYYYLVDWEPTIEPASNLPMNVIATFRRQRRALVRKTFIEDEAREG